MKKHLLNKLLFVTAVVALSFAAIETQFTHTVQAAVITYDFEGKVTGTTLPQYGLINDFTGSFSYDDSQGYSNGSTEKFSLLSYTDSLFKFPSNYNLAFKAQTENGVFSGLFGQRFPFYTGSLIYQYEGSAGTYFQKGFDPSLPPPNAIYLKVDFFDLSYFLRRPQC